MIEIQLSGGQKAKVSDADFDLVSRFTWHMQSNGYARTKINGRAVLMHRLIMSTPENLETDHINRDRLDNQRSNLRVCTRKENLQNKGAYKSSSSGVFWAKNIGKWEVKIQVMNKRKTYGYYQSKSEALAVAKLARMEA